MLEFMVTIYFSGFFLFFLCSLIVEQEIENFDKALARGIFWPYVLVKILISGFKKI